MVNNRSERDIFIDTLRGLMLIIMTLDHTPLDTKRFTYSTFGFFGAAMGFIFLSGYVFGFVYSRYLETPKSLVKKTYKRIWLIYRYHIGAFIFVLLIDLLSIHFLNKGPLSDGIAEIYNNPIDLLKFVLLLEQPVFFDILPLYIVFLTFSPFVLIGFKKGYVKLILSISFILFFMFQISGVQLFYNNLQLELGIKLGNFNLFAWQFLFIAGQFLGYNRYQGLQVVKYNKQALWVFSILAIMIIIVRQVGETKVWGVVYKLLYEREYLQLPRLISFFIVAYLVGGISKQIKVKNINYLAFLGQYSIDVFAFHIPIAYITLKSSEIITGLSMPIQILVAHCLIACLVIPAIIKLELKLKKKENRMCRLIKNMSLFFSFPKDLVHIFVESKIKKKF